MEIILIDKNNPDSMWILEINKIITGKDWQVYRYNKVYSSEDGILLMNRNNGLFYDLGGHVKTHAFMPLIPIKQIVVILTNLLLSGEDIPIWIYRGRRKNYFE